jgi:hypothetical protein
MLIDLNISFEEFLKQARKHNMFYYAFNIEDLIMEKYQSKGYNREQIFKTRLKEFWPLIKNYKCRTKQHFYIKKTFEKQKIKP